MNGPVPPVSDAVAPPSDKPLQETLESTTAAATSKAGSVMFTDAVSFHPFTSVIVTVYDPAASPVIEAVVPPLDHA